LRNGGRRQLAGLGAVCGGIRAGGGSALVAGVSVAGALKGILRNPRRRKRVDGTRVLCRRHTTRGNRPCASGHFFGASALALTMTATASAAHYFRGSAGDPETLDPHKTSTVVEAHILRDLPRRARHQQRRWVSHP